MSEPTTSTKEQPQQMRQFPCTNCGASLSYSPGSRSLKCPHCGTANQLPEESERVNERDFLEELAAIEGQAECFEPLEVHCGACGAATTMPQGVVALECPFCSNPIVETAKAKRLIRPQGMLPFALSRQQAMTAFEKWLQGLWLAPNDLKSRAVSDSRFAGVYLPFWIFDTDTTSRYTGERGDDYWTTESYTDSQGKRQTRQVRRTRWTYVSGTVHGKFQDVIIHASDSLPTDMVDELQPWDLRQVVPYRDEYVAGFRAEAYKIPLRQGFTLATQVLEPRIEQLIRTDIGGDHQRIGSVNTRHFNIKFQHLLLPVWVSSFHYAGKVYQFIVNARTGEVQGRRPYSTWKIGFLVAIGLILLGLLIFFMTTK